MHYQGGKHRIRKHIADVIIAYSPDRTRPYYEPFVGGANIVSEIALRWDGPIYASDANTAVITMWRESCNGWVPPDTLSESEYAEIKARNDADDPITAFAMVGCSFAGRYGQGYARSGRSNYNYATSTKRGVLRKVKAMQCNPPVWRACDYREIQPVDSVIYCDPPYESTKRYSGVDAFNSDTFWDTVRKWRDNGNTIFISEMNAPDDMKCIWQKEYRRVLRKKSGAELVIERVFMPLRIDT